MTSVIPPVPSAARRRVPLVLALAIPLWACWGGGDPEPASVAPPRVVITLDRHYYDNTGGIQDSVNVVLRDRASFEDRWIRATSLQPSPPPAPDIDFSSRMAVLVGAGPMEPGAEIRVDSAGVQRRSTADRGDQEVLVIFVQITEGCPGFNVRSYPVEIVSLPVFDPPVEFRTSVRPATACQEAAASVPLAPSDDPVPMVLERSRGG